MPTYEYRCRDCGEDLEVVQSIHDDSLTECPKCGGSLRKVFGNVGVVFKGSGFYKTDSRKKEAAPASTAKKSDSKASDSASKSDTPKPDSTSKAESSSTSTAPTSSSGTSDSKS